MQKALLIALALGTVIAPAWSAADGKGGTVPGVSRVEPTVDMPAVPAPGAVAETLEMDAVPFALRPTELAPALPGEAAPIVPSPIIVLSESAPASERARPVLASLEITAQGLAAPHAPAREISAHFFDNLPVGPAPEQAPARLRDLGIAIGRGTPGHYNAITDVAGVQVGHVTLDQGEPPGAPGQGPARTGVTAIIPHYDDIWLSKVPAATHVINGNGELTGSIWIDTQGALEVPIILTNTMDVGAASQGVQRYMMLNNPHIGVSDDTPIAVVGECNDSYLNDARGCHVKPEHVVEAISKARTGPVAEGGVGAGTGMSGFDFKAGIGTASRVLPRKQGGWTVGALVNNNTAERHQLTVSGVPVGREMTDIPVLGYHSEGSIIIVVATDAPMDHLKLKRLAGSVALGLARTGATAPHSSGDIVIAFSTGNRIPHFPGGRTLDMKVVPDRDMSALFEAVQEAVEEAILNSLTAARTTVGFEGNTSRAIPLDRLRDVMRKYNRLP